MRPSDAEVQAFLDEHRAAFGAIWPVQFMMVSLAPTLLGAFRGAHFFYYYCCCCYHNHSSRCLCEDYYYYYRYHYRYYYYYSPPP